MLASLRRRLPALARAVLGIAGVVWLTAAAAPCVMAAPCVPPPEPTCHGPAPDDHHPACPAAGGVDCQLPSAYSPASIDLAGHLPVLPPAAVPPLALQPGAPAGTPHATAPPGGIPSPPLYLRHLALLF